MHVLIVESNPSLGLIWARHLERFGARVVLVDAPPPAIQALTDTEAMLFSTSCWVTGRR